MHVRTLLLLLALASCAGCRTMSPPNRAERVLFVGNSLTYVGNVPAVFSALAESGGRRVTSDMIVEGGATLSQRVADHTVAQALGRSQYTVLVLQERGGDLTCAFGPKSCVDSRNAIGVLSRMARSKGARVLLLGTCQPLPAASRHLVQEERAAADAAGIGYVEVSETLLRLRSTAPQLDWVAADGMHPGKDLALLNAMRLHHAIFRASPRPGALVVNAPIYTSNSGLSATLRAANAPPPLAETAVEVRYPEEVVATVRVGIDRAVENTGAAAWLRAEPHDR